MKIQTVRRLRPGEVRTAVATATLSAALFAALVTPLRAQAPPPREVASFDRFDRFDGAGDNRVNAYLMAHLTRLVYNDRVAVDLGQDGPIEPSTAFLDAFKERTRHWFTDLEEPVPPEAPDFPVPPCVGDTCPCRAYEASKRLARPNLPASNLTLRRGTTLSAPKGYRILRTASLAESRLTPLPAGPVELIPKQGAKPEPTCTRALARYKAAYKARERAYQRALEVYQVRRERWQSERPEYRFFDRTSDGFDPEVMLVSTGRVVLVLFRGTDRVESADSEFAYDWSEWIDTDFNASKIEPGDGLRGRVHRGFWNSLSLIKRELADAVIEVGGAEKPIWIAGHSLGGAHAQLFAAYLRQVHDIQAEALWVYGSPHVGDQEFRAELEGMLSENAIQRFEFGFDAATGTPPYSMGYERVGLRNHYVGVAPGDYTFAQKERNPLILDIPIEPCHHHSEWYVIAAFNQLPPAVRNELPAPPLPPTASSAGCTTVDITLLLGL